MRRLLVLFLFINIFILTSCSLATSSNEQNEIKRLASENIKLRQELMELKSEVDKLKADNEGLRESLEINILSKEEQYNKMSRDIMEIINKVNKSGNFKRLIKMYPPYLSGKYIEEYGGIIYKKIQSEGIEKFISLLKEEHISSIDNITSSLAVYCKNNKTVDNLNKIIVEYEKNNKIKSDSMDFYILLRLNKLMDK